MSRARGRCRHSKQAHFDSVGKCEAMLIKQRFHFLQAELPYRHIERGLFVTSALDDVEIGVLATTIEPFNLSLHPHACTKGVLQHAIDNVNKLADGKCWIFFSHRVLFFQLKSASQSFQ